MVAYLGSVRTVHVDSLIILLYVTNIRIMSQEERRLDSLKINSYGAAQEAPTCAVTRALFGKGWGR